MENEALETRDLTFKIHRRNVLVDWDICPAFEMWVQKLAVERKVQTDGTIRRPWIQIVEKRNYPKHQDTCYIIDSMEDDWETILEWLEDNDGLACEGEDWE